MRKTLLTTVLALGSLSVAWAAPTPVNLDVKVTSGDNSEELASFNVKFVTPGTDSYPETVPAFDGIKVDNTKMPVLTLSGTDYPVSKAEPLGIRTVVTCTMSPTITAAGVYTISVPEGFITWGDGEYCNAAAATTITVAGGAMSQDDFIKLGVGIDPNPQEDQTSMGSVTLGAVGNIKFGTSTMWSAGASMTGIKYSMQPSLGDDQKSLRFAFPADLTEPGEYEFTVPADVFKVITADREISNPRISYTFRIVGGGGGGTTVVTTPVTLESSPLNASVSADSFSKFAILVKADGAAIADALTIDNQKVASVKVSGQNGNFVPSAVRVASEASTVELEFANPVQVAGTYSITLPEGLIAWNGNTNSEATLADAFTVTGEVSNVFEKITWRNGNDWANAEDLGADLTSATGFGTLFGSFDNIPAGETLNVPSPYDDNDEVRPDAKKFVCITPEGKEITGFIYSVMSNGVPVNNTFRVRLSSTSSYIKVPGEYKLTIPAGSMSVNGFMNPEIQQSFFVKDDRYYEPVDLGMFTTPNPSIPAEYLTYVSFRFNNVDPSDDTEKLYTSKGVAYGAKAICQKEGSDEVFEVALKSDSYAGSSLLGYEIVFDNRIADPGQYRITLPQGSINLERESDGKLVTNTEFSVVYTVMESEIPSNAIDVAIPVSPNTNEKVYSLSRFEFSAPAGYSLYVPDVTKAFVFKTPDGKEELVHPYSNGNVAGDYAFLELPEQYTTPGTYTLTVPVGGFELVADEQLFVNKELVYTYELVPAEEVELEWTASPANGSVLYSFMQAYVSFTDKVTSIASGVKAQVTTDAATQLNTASVSFSSANNRLMVDLMPFIGKYGEYEIEIPAAIVKTEDGRVNKPIILHYVYETVVVDNDMQLVCSPAEGKVYDQTAFSNITVSAPEGWVGMRTTDSGATRVYFRFNEEESKAVSLSSNGDASYRLDLENMTFSKGDYELTIPAQTFIVTAENGRQVYNPAQTFFWMYDPNGNVTAIASENGLYTVFTLDGNCVMRDVDADQLRTLENGIYIINGTKVIRR